MKTFESCTELLPLTTHHVTAKSYDRGERRRCEENVRARAHAWSLRARAVAHVPDAISPPRIVDKSRWSGGTLRAAVVSGVFALSHTRTCPHGVPVVPNTHLCCAPFSRFHRRCLAPVPCPHVVAVHNGPTRKHPAKRIALSRYASHSAAAGELADSCRRAERIRGTSSAPTAVQCPHRYRWPAAMSETKLLIGNDMIASKNMLNPFVHHLELTSTYDKFKTAFFTIVVLPVRIMAILVLLFIAWMLANIGLIGVSQSDLSEKPLSGWRRYFRRWICFVGRFAYLAGGMNIVIKGVKATRKEAPILVVAPHSTFLDSCISYVTGFPSIIARIEDALNPWVGRVINFTQPVYVRRDDPESRHNTIQEIIRRVKSDQDWPQILIFPEGTCTNRSCLITFKPGAFYPAVPVQPVLLRYPNKLDTVTWTWDGPGALKLLWLTMTQPTTTVEVEFLPVYVPSEYEKQNPKAFAEGVRNVMAKALAVPTADYTYDDCRVAVKAGQLGLPMTSNLITIERLRSRLGLTRIKIEDSALVKNMLSFQNRELQPIDLAEFANNLNVTVEDGSLISLFKMHLEDENLSTIDFKKYLLAEYILQKATHKDDPIVLAFKLYGECFDKEMFEYVLNLVYNLPKSEASVVYSEMTDKPNEIRLAEYLLYGKKYPEKMDALLDRSKSSAPRTVTDFSSCAQSSSHGDGSAVDDKKSQ